MAKTYRAAPEKSAATVAYQGNVNRKRVEKVLTAEPNAKAPARKAAATTQIQCKVEKQKRPTIRRVGRYKCEFKI
jgi:hypothetical protein